MQLQCLLVNICYISSPAGCSILCNLLYNHPHNGPGLGGYGYEERNILILEKKNLADVRNIHLFSNS